MLNQNRQPPLIKDYVKFSLRIVTGIILGSLIISSVFINKLIFYLILINFQIISILELKRMTDNFFKNLISVPMWIIFTVFLDLIIFFFVKNYELISNLSVFNSSLVLPFVISIISILIIIIIKNIINYQSTDNSEIMNMIIYEFFLFFYFIGGLSLSLLLFEIKNGLFFLFIVITNYSHDIFAYFGGKLFGKTKFFNNISPSKTLEGYISGVVFSFLIGYTISIKFNLLVLDYYKIILITLAIAFLSVFGDLFESVIKRAAQVKESGNIIPGHGGVLDRIDSLIFSIFISFFMYFIP